MRDVCLSDSEFLLIELAVCLALSRAAGSLDRLREMEAPTDPETSEEMQWLIEWAETSVAQQDQALASLRKPFRGAGPQTKPISP